MSEENEERGRGSATERHVQTVVVGILLALLLWNGNTLIDLKTDVATLKVTVGGLDGALRVSGEDRFRASDWRREREILEQRFQRNEAEVAALRVRHEAENVHNHPDNGRPRAR
jgi:hypothetical protein